jgi:beta-glucosidase/6-phospho-beta-glucosidase/beta-galactosidase
LLGKGQSIWDHKSHTGGIYKNQTGDIACDSYHRYEEDIQLLTELNVIMT